MSKRSLSETADGPLGTSASLSSPTSKRLKSNCMDISGALALIVDNSDKLIDCIKTLASQRSKFAKDTDQKLDLDSLELSTRKCLMRLSKKLLPAFQLFQEQSPVGTEQPLIQLQTDTTLSRSAPARVLAAKTYVAKWTSSEIPRTLPPLIEVLDPVLESAALTHSSMAAHLNYERLEWIGDSHLYSIATALVYHTFPTLVPGRMAQIREILVRNATLAEYAVHYGLDKRAKLPAEFGAGGRSGGGTKATASAALKVKGDLFEAYVGAAILSDPENGLSRVANWLKALWSTTISSQIRNEERRLGNEKTISSATGSGNQAKSERVLDPKVRLAIAIKVKTVQLRYEEIVSKKKTDRDTKLPLLTVGVYLDGWGERNKLLGHGSALSKSEAGQKAAQAALDNEKMIKFYAGKKQAFMAAIGDGKSEM